MTAKGEIISIDGTSGLGFGAGTADDLFDVVGVYLLQIMVVPRNHHDIGFVGNQRLDAFDQRDVFLVLQVLRADSRSLACKIDERANYWQRDSFLERKNLLFERELSAVRAIRQQRMVHGNDGGLLLIFINLVFEFQKELLARFDVTIFVDCGMLVPVFKVPFTVDKDQRHIVIDIHMVDGAIVSGQERLFAFEIVVDDFLLRRKPVDAAIPIVVARDENGFPFELFGEFELVLELFLGGFSIGITFFGHPFGIDVVAQKNQRTARIGLCQTVPEYREQLLGFFKVGVSCIAHEVKSMRNGFGIVKIVLDGSWQTGPELGMIRGAGSQQ